MKMHAEKKHKCSKCSNSYGTKWDLKRHAEDCGQTFQCTGAAVPMAAGLHYSPTSTQPSKKRRMESRLAQNGSGPGGDC